MRRPREGGRQWPPPHGGAGRNLRGGRGGPLCEIGRSLPRHLSTVGPTNGGPVGRTISPPRRARSSPCEHGRTSEPIARRTGDPCLLEEGPRPGARARRDRARHGARRPAGPAGPRAVHGHDRRSGPDGDDRPAGAQRRRRSADRAGGRGHGAGARVDLLPGQPRDRLARDPARARQPRQLRLRLGAELHRVQAQRPRLRLPRREPRDLGLHGHVARPGPAHLLPGQRAGQGHAPAPPPDGRGARRALRRQPGADAGQRRQQPRRRARRQARLLAHRPDGPLARRRRGLELHRLQPRRGPRPAASTTCAA